MSTHFFLTGGTGLVGSSLVPRLLRAYPASTMTLLVRSRTEDEAHRRAQDVAREAERDFEVPDALRRVDGVRGDVALDGCGLTDASLSRIVAETTHMIHGAATIRFDHPLQEARAINCGGTRKMLDIARRCTEKGQLARFVYIGTSSVSGRREGNILEDELEAGQEFFNTYEQSKCEAERLVRDHFNHLPALIFRPSIIIGDSCTGKTPIFQVIYIPLRLLYQGLLPCIPARPGTTVDLVPVDWVNDVMVHIMGRDEARGKVFHVTAGPSRAATLGELLELATTYFDAHAPLAPPRGTEFISQEEYERRRSHARGRERALMTQLDSLLPYTGIDRLFDSRNTDRMLEGSDIRFPMFRTYADHIFAYCLEARWGKKKP